MHAASAPVRTRFQNLDLQTDLAIVTSARKGIKTKLFYDLADAVRMSERSLALLINLSFRTIDNYRQANKTFQPVQGEHLLKLIALYTKGEEIFGNIEEFNYWLQKPSWNAKEKPIDWLITPGGVDLVSNELDRLAHAYAV